MTNFIIFRDYALNYIKQSTVGLTAEQLVDVVAKKYEADNHHIDGFIRKEIRTAISALINYPHIKFVFGYYYWKD